MNILVTGATIGGIGFETARHLASLGHKLIITSRNQDRAITAADAIEKQVVCIRPEAMNLDLSESDSIKSFFEKLSEKIDTLDVLINNAGFLKTDLFVNTKGIEMTMAVNYWGTRELTGLLLPLIPQGGRIINLTSNTAFLGKLNPFPVPQKKKWNGFQAYFNSKYALNMYTRDLAYELKGQGITVNAVHPGNIITNIWNELWPDNRILGKAIDLVKNTGMISAVKGSKTSIYLATSTELDTATDGYYVNKRLKPWPSNSRNLDKNRIVLQEYHQSLK